MIHDRHLTKLAECNHAIEAVVQKKPELASTWVGKSAKSWFSITAGDDGNAIKFSDVEHNRNSLRDYILAQKQAGINGDELLDIVVNIFAWGGMAYRHGRKALRCWENWMPICAALVDGMDHLTAYQGFYQAQHNGKMVGIGPAYYTKLIFFLGNGDGLIMDQWTSKSINLLHEDNLIRLDSGYVSRFAGSDDYKRYNECVSELAGALGFNGTNFEKNNKTEELIFSISGKKKPAFLTTEDHKIFSEWRRYVVQEWKTYR